jgi:hypothetical protein
MKSDRDLQTFARRMRREPTSAEQKLWYRNIQSVGIRILRVWNFDILQNIETILHKILETAANSHLNPLPNDLTLYTSFQQGSRSRPVSDLNNPLAGTQAPTILKEMCSMFSPKEEEI